MTGICYTILKDKNRKDFKNEKKILSNFRY